MRSTILPLTAAAAAMVLFSGCGEATAPAAAPTTQGSITASTPNAASSTPTSTPTGAPTGDPSPRPAANALVLTVDGTTTDIAPTDVYCTRSGDTLRHMIGKTSNRPPLVETDGTDFVMVKLGDGAPYKAQRPTGITFTTDSVTFSKVVLGDATLDGTMVCTAFEG